MAAQTSICPTQTSICPTVCLIGTVYSHTETDSPGHGTSTSEMTPIKTASMLGLIATQEYNDTVSVPVNRTRNVH